MTIYNLINWVYVLFLVMVVVFAVWHFFETKKIINKIGAVLVIVLFLLRIFSIK